MQLRRGLIAGMANGRYKLIYTDEVDASTTSTTPIKLTDISAGSSAYTSNKILFVKIRDKAGKRAGYFYGMDNFVINYFPSISAATSATSISKFCYKCNDNAQIISTLDSFGVFVAQVNSSGDIRINARYSETTSLTIDGTYKIDVYLLDWPNNDNPFTE